MSETTEKKTLETEERLTPKHSIPSGIHSLIISGSKGRFQSSTPDPSQVFKSQENPSIFGIKKNPEKHLTFHEPKSLIFENLYQDAAKRSAIKNQLTSYESIKQKKEEEKFKSDKKLSKAESSELFERLSKEASTRQEKYEISRQLKNDQEIKVLVKPNINKSQKILKQDVVTRLLEYGETIKRKNEERIKSKKEREDEEIRNIPSVHKRTSTSYSCYNSPGKYTSNKSAEKTNQSFNTISSSFHIPGLNTSNSPEKIIKKIQNISSIKTKFTAISKRVGYRTSKK